MCVGDDEDIAKAIPSDKFDSFSGEISGSLFKGVDSSVSRLSVTPLDETWCLFRKRVAKPPERTIDRIGIINIGKLKQVGSNFAANPTNLSVEAKPLEGYPSHAEIPQKISRGLSNEIIKNLQICQEN